MLVVRDSPIVIAPNLSTLFLQCLLVNLLPRSDEVLVVPVCDDVRIGCVNVAIGRDPFDHPIVQKLLRECFDVLTEAIR